eukprot:12934798-Prorocentrum_lima.AAC.1
MTWITHRTIQEDQRYNPEVQSEVPLLDHWETRMLGMKKMKMMMTDARQVLKERSPREQDGPSLHHRNRATALAL